jgi:hypothetical protein
LAREFRRRDEEGENRADFVYLDTRRVPVTGVAEKTYAA